MKPCRMAREAHEREKSKSAKSFADLAEDLRNGVIKNGVIKIKIIKVIESTIEYEDGIVLGGKCFVGKEFGYIVEVTSKTTKIKWRTGYTTQLRPDLGDVE
jgi:hypothetical protein